MSCLSIHFLVLMDGFWPLQHSGHTRHSNEKPLLIQQQYVLISINRSQVLCFLHEREHNSSTSTSLPLNGCQLPGEKPVMCDVDSGEVWTHAPESDAHDVLTIPIWDIIFGLTVSYFWWRSFEYCWNNGAAAF